MFETKALKLAEEPKVVSDRRAWNQNTSLRVAAYIHFRHSRGLMKKPVTFRIEQSLLEQARHSAQAENRTLTNFVETLLKTKVGVLAQAKHPQSDQVVRKRFRKSGGSPSDCG
jgi:hypothetical protein